MGTNVGKDLKRGFLAVATSGTSEIKTGAGQYGDETVADSLFPKTVNDAMLDDRTQGRKDTDAQAKADAAAANPGAIPDATDARLMMARRSAALRLTQGQDRKNSFNGAL